MKKILLPSLGFEFDMHDDFYFHDDGIVKDIDEHRKELYKNHNLEYSDEPRHCPADSVQTAGCSIISRDNVSLKNAIKMKKGIDAHIYVKDNFGDYYTKFLKCHEETHILHYFDKLHLLKNALENVGIKSDDIESERIEVICEIGGFYGVNLHENPDFSIYVYSNSNGITNTDYWKRMTEWISQRSNIIFRLI